jgi:hypothetical protein
LEADIRALEATWSISGLVWSCKGSIESKVAAWVIS